MKFFLKLVLLFVLQNWNIQESSSLETKDAASSHSRQFTGNPADTFTPIPESLKISTPRIKWSVSSSNSSPAASTLLKDSMFLAPTSIYPLSTSNVLTSASSLTSMSPKSTVFPSIVSSTESFLSLMFTSKVSGARESDIRVILSLKVPPCHDDDEGNMLEDHCSTSNITLDVTCYTDNRTFNICMAAEPVNTFITNDQFYDYARNVADQDGSLDLCDITAAALYNLFFTNKAYKHRSGKRASVILDDDQIYICLPIFQYISDCSSDDVITTCVEGDLTVMFLADACRLPALPYSVIEKALATLVLRNHSEEIKKICNGYLGSFEQNNEDTSLNTSSVEEPAFKIVWFYGVPSCGYDNDTVSERTNTYTICPRDNTTFYISCYSNGTFNICLNELPINSFTNNNQFLNYVRNTSVYQSNDVLGICQLTAFVHGSNGTLPHNKIDLKVKTYFLIHVQEVIEICLPIIQFLGNCSYIEEAIECNINNNVVFFAPRGCILPSRLEEIAAKILFTNFLAKNFTQVKEICNGTLSYPKEVIKGIDVIFIPIQQEVQYPLFKNSSSNIYWPCCYKNYIIVWNEDPKTVGLNQHWSYLPLECQLGEISLMVFQGVTSIVGLIGNSIVLAVMFNGGHRGEASSFLRISLCLSDLFMSAFVMIPAMYDNIAIIHGDIVYTYFKENLDSVNEETYTYYTMRFNDNNEEPTSDISDFSTYYPLFSYINGWFQVIRGKLLCLCSCVTMLMMFCLSAERFVLCWCPLKYKALFLMYRVKLAIFLAWSFGLVSSIVISYDYNFAVFWNSWTKLSFGFTDGVKHDNLSVEVISGILCVFGILTFSLSLSALVAFRLEIKRIKKERESLDMRVTDDFEKENLYITISLILMAVFYLIAYLPIGIHVLSKHEQFRATKYPLLMFLSWWLLLAGSSWNPFIYNFRSHLFRSELAELIEKFLPESQKDRMKPYITHPRHPRERYLKGLDQEAAITGERHDGLPKGSKLARLGLGFDNKSHDTGENEGNICETAL